MRCLTCYTPGKHRIDIFKSWLGKEEVFYDGALVSSQRSLSGGRHTFNVRENAAAVEYQIRIALRWPQITGVDIYRNGSALLLF